MKNKKQTSYSRAVANGSLSNIGNGNPSIDSDEMNNIMNKQESEHKKHMQSIIKPIELKTFKAYPFVIAIMAVLQMLIIVYGRHIVDVFGTAVALGNLVFTPLLLYTFQIVAECYGWQYGRQIVWLNFTVNGLITLFCFAFTFVPYSVYTHADLKYSYEHLIDKMWFSAMLNWFSIFAIDYVSTIITCKSRVMYKGGWLFLRLVLVQLLSEVIYCSAGAIAYWYNNYTLTDIMYLQYHAFIARTITAVILIPLVMSAIWLIQEKIERVVAFDTGRDSWNIFHWNVDHKNTIQFDAKEWSRLSAEKKKRVDISKIALDYYDDDKLGIDKIFKKKDK
jgi:hypothetical protein